MAGDVVFRPVTPLYRPTRRELILQTGQSSQVKSPLKILMLVPEPFFTPRGTPYSVRGRAPFPLILTRTSKKGWKSR